MSVRAAAPVINTREDSVVQFLGLPTVVRATKETTNGAFGLLEHPAIPPGFASPYHVHHGEDEAFYVLDGQVAFCCDGEWFDAGPGAYVFGPRDIPHGFKIVGDRPAHMLLLLTPGGFEQFMLDLCEPLGTPPSPPDIPKMIALAAEYKAEILGPLPERPE